MSSPLDSRQLRALSALARTGSFTLAAQDLHLTQSAVSHAIRALEEDVGCRVVDRVGKTVLINQAGERLLQSAEKILKEMEMARLDLKQLGQWGRGRVRIGATSTACQHILPTVIREFKNQFPTCAISIEPADTPQAMESLRQNRTDLAIVLEMKTEAAFEFRPLFVDELRFILSPQHAWGKERSVRRDTISQQNFILYQRKSETFRMVEKYFAEEQKELSTVIELGSMEAIKELVKLDLGVSILAPWTARKELADGSLVELALGPRKLKRHWGIAHWRGRRLNLAEETFIGICHSQIEKIISSSTSSSN